MNVRNEVRSRLVCEGVTMQGVLVRLEQQYGWSRSISNLSGKLHRETLRYKEAVELADVLGYEIVWKKRGVSVSAYGERCAYLGEIKFDVGRSCGLFWNWYQ